MVYSRNACEVRCVAAQFRKVDVKLPGKRNSNSHGPRPVHQNHLDDKVDPDQKVVNKELSLAGQWWPRSRGSGTRDSSSSAPRSTLTPHTLHPTPYTLHPTPYTLHPTPYTLHPTPYILHPEPYTSHPAPHTPQPAPRTLNPNARPLQVNSASRMRATGTPGRIQISHATCTQLADATGARPPHPASSLFPRGDLRSPLALPRLSTKPPPSLNVALHLTGSHAGDCMGPTRCLWAWVVEPGGNGLHLTGC